MSLSYCSPLPVDPAIRPDLHPCISPLSMFQHLKPPSVGVISLPDFSIARRVDIVDTPILIEVDVSCGSVPARFAGDHGSVRSEVVQLPMPDPVAVCQQFADFIHLALGLVGVIGFPTRFEVPSFS